MEVYTYLFLGIWLCAFWVLFALIRPDLRPLMIHSGWIGAILGPLSEYWYFQDYWRPITLIGAGHVSLEDMLFGFAITGIGVACADVVLATRSTSIDAPKRMITRLLAFFLIGLVGLVIGTDFFGVNSILASSGLWLVFSFAILCLRRDLALRCFVSALFCILIILPIYPVLFFWMSPEYIDHYWIVARNPLLGYRVFPGLPFAEVLWYGSWGCFSGIVLPFSSGSKIVPLHHSDHSSSH